MEQKAIFSNAENLQYSGDVQLKLIETQARLDHVFDEFGGRIESLTQIFDLLKEGVTVIGPGDEIFYTNSSTTRMLNDGVSGNKLQSVLKYRDLSKDEIIELKADNQRTFTVRTRNINWSGEQSNLFIIEETLTATAGKHAKGELLKYIELISEYQAQGKTTEAARYSNLALEFVSDTEKTLIATRAYLKLAGHSVQLSTVQMKNVLDEALKAIQPVVKAAGAEVNTSVLPGVNADKELIIQLLTYLLDNALKFRRKDKKTVIDIGSDSMDGDVIICVRDNGIGISKKFHAQIFGLFEKLNPDDEYPGNGMGLTMAQKIVEMHGGKIWIESLPGHGSSFYFTLKSI